MTKGERTRGHLLHSAATLIAREGLKKLTARSLADEAGVSPALVIHYIPDMEEVMYLVTQHIFATERARPVTKEKSGPFEVIEELATGNFNFFREHPSYYKCLMLSYFHASYDKRFRDLHKKNLNAVRRIIRSALEEMAKNNRAKISRERPGEIAQSIMEIVEGALLFCALEGSHANAARARTVKQIKILVASLELRAGAGA